MRASAFRSSSFHFVVAAIVATCGSVARAGDGLLVVSLGVPVDSTSSRAAVQVAAAARDAVAGQSDLTVVDVEALLDATDFPPAVAKITEAKRLKDKADTGLSMVDLPVAADAYADALVAFEQGAAALTDINDVVDTFEKQATTFVLQGETAAAKQSFERVLALDPGFRLAADAPPRAKKIFDEVVKGWRTPPMGKLTVFATTGAAEVWIEGVRREGASPMTVDVPAGRHLIRVYREGYRAWGGAVDVKKGSEATAQAALKPTAGFAKLDDLLGRVARNPDNAQNVSDVARFLKVDRVLITVVETQGPVANISGFWVNGVAGSVERKGQKSISVEGDFFQRDTTTFIRQRFLEGGNVGSVDDGGGTKIDDKVPPDRRGPSRLPGDAEKVETPGMVIGGWVLVSTSVVPLATGIVLGVLTLNQNEAFHSRQQVATDLDEVKSSWLFTSIGADVSYVVAAGMIGSGALLLVNGYAEQSALEDVMEPGK